MKKIFSIVVFILFVFQLNAQNGQTIKGNVQDNEIKFPLEGAVVVLFKDSTMISNAKVDSNGFFRMEHVAIGKYKIFASYLGYKDVTLFNIEVNSGKETQLQIFMEPSHKSLQEVKITSSKLDVNNEMALVSARTFDPGEASRYTASRDDIARMATNFAGVRGSDDSRNDIVIRGNTPNGIVWRIEDLDVQNPNHFASFGSTGGPVNIINNKLLARSDFMTAAFPADYGNGISGVFDLRLRNGNKDKHEFTTQIGILGLEATAEGPINKKTKSSYTFSYRYSTLALMNALGLNFGVSGTPAYQDVNLKLHFPINTKSEINVFALAGKSDYALEDSGLDSTKWTFGRAGRDIHFGSRFILAGANFQQTINATTYHKFTLGYNKSVMYSRYDTLTPSTLDLVATYRSRFNNDKFMLHYFINKRYGNNVVFKTGVQLTQYFLNLVDSNFYPSQNIWYNEAEFKGATQMLQAYTAWKYTPSDKLQLNAGLHYIHFLLNNSKALEPRLGLSYAISEKIKFTAGYGLHSNLQQLFIYFLQKNDIGGYPYLYNMRTGFNRSHHAVSGLEFFFSRTLHLKTEVYYQYLFNLPIEKKSSAYSSLNQGASFNFIFPDELSNRGIGYNAGIDITLEQFFNKSFYYLLTGSVFTSKYRASDNVWRNTDFNAGYNFNLLSGKEWKVGSKKNTSLLAGIKFNYAGGKWYSPIDSVASKNARQYVGIDSKTNTLQFKPYNRLDARFGFKLNRPKVHHNFYLDLLNVYNQKNPLALSYIPSTGEVVEEKNLAFLPLFNWLIEF